MKTLAALIAAVALLPQTPPRDNARSGAPDSGTAAIRGRIVASDTGAPIRFASVMLSRMDPSLRRSISTDALGRFSFDALPAGSFVLTATPASTSSRYLAASFGASPTQASQRIDIADGQVLSGVEIRLPLAATISGRVVDDNGEALGRIQVAAVARGAGSRPQRLGGGETDDQGRFRIFGLRPGDDVMVLADAPLGGFPVSDGTSTPMLVSTYHPQTTSMGEARRFRLRPGTEIQDVEIAMIRTRTFRVSGVVLNSRGSPATDGSAPLLNHRTTFGGWGEQVPIRSDGRFTIRNVAPGSYQIIVRPQPDRSSEYATVSFTVGDADIDDLVVTTKPAFDLAGRVTFEPQPPAATPGGIRIVPYTADGDTLWTAEAPVKTDGTFVLKGIFDRVLLRPQGGPIEDGLKAVYLGNEDITDVPREFGPDDSARLRIVMTTRPSAIGGLVLDERDAPTRDYVVVLFPADRAAWTPASSFVQTATPDRFGRFRLIRVRPGRYRIAALPPSAFIDPAGNHAALFDALYADAMEILINEDEQSAIDLKRLAAPAIDK